MGAPILRNEELRAIEAKHAAAHPPLMERAGRAVAERARSLAKDTGSAMLVGAGPRNQCDALGLGADTASAARGHRIGPDDVAGWLTPRARNSNKGTFGTVAIIGGNKGMVGAAILAARAALHCGAGKVYAGLLASDAPSVDLSQPELMLRSLDDALSAPG